MLANVPPLQLWSELLAQGRVNDQAPASSLGSGLVTDWTLALCLKSWSVRKEATGWVLCCFVHGEVIEHGVQARKLDHAQVLA
mmetsp:Transcript_37927/g.66871  ORF Transcript_37927/g.66871 Transcript_37927/m.66871 type:complete len:83 (-) Transcript_37927:1039-1287(-)